MKWPFDQAPDVMAVTTRPVMESGLPILSVIHYSEDHSWAFLCGTVDARDSLLVCMKNAFHLDPTLAEIADLPPGWVAERKAVGEPWDRHADPDY